MEDRLFEPFQQGGAGLRKDCAEKPLPAFFGF
jgi:hypothetical protein